jgi:hypothetical protein
MDTERKPLPPYLPYKTFLTFLDHLRAIGVPSHIDKSVMKSMSGGMQSWLRAALRYMNLVTGADDVPTPTLKRLVEAQGEDRKAVLRELFDRSYAFLLTDIDLSNTTPAKLRSAITAINQSSDTADKIIAFLLALAKDAGVPLSKLLTTRTTGPRKPRAKPAATRQPASAVDVENDPDDEPGATDSTAMKTIELPMAGGTLTLSGNINLFALVGAERELVFALIDAMRKFEEGSPV